MNDKQRLFVAEFLIDLNATQAAIRAGYSAKTAEQQGCRLLRNAQVAAAIDEAKVDRAEKAKIDAAWVLNEAVGIFELARDKAKDTKSATMIAAARGTLELIGKHVGVQAFNEKVDHISSDGSMSPPSLSDFYASMRKPAEKK